MRSLLPVFAVLVCHSELAQATTEYEDAVAIIRTVIQREAEDLRRWSSGPVACVNRVVQETTLDGFRRSREQAPGAASNRGPMQIIAQEIGVVDFRWTRRPGDSEGQMVELEATERRLLADAVAAIVAESERPRLVSSIEDDWVTEPFRVCDQEDLGMLTLQSPAIHGDVAFVSVDFECVLCGHGIDYALRRRGERWEILAEITRWVS